LNWQVLCRWCNIGKGTWLSGLQSAEAWGWIYRTDRSTSRRHVSPQARYVILTQRGTCDAKGCSATPTSAHLLVLRRVESALPVADNLTIRCDAHIDGLDMSDDPAFRELLPILADAG